MDKVKRHVNSLASGPGGPLPARVWAETKLQVRIATPVVLGYLLQLSLNLIIIFIVGRTGGAHELAAVSLANMYVIVTGLSVAYGLAAALDTLCSQEYGRNPHSKMVGVYVQRGVLISFAVSIPIITLWLVSEQILVGLKQDPDIAALAGEMIRILAGALPFVLVFECQKRYLSAMGNTLPIFFTMIAAVAIVALACYLFVVVADMGFTGAGLSLALGWVVQPLFMHVYFLLSRVHVQTWGGWSRKALRGWKEYLRYGLPGMAMVCNEWWALEILALVAGVMGEAELATHAIVATTASLSYMIPYGVGVAATTRVGNELGAGHRSKAQLAAWVSLCIGICISLLLSTLLLSLRTHWSTLFTDDESVSPLVARVLLVYGSFHILDGLQSIVSGVVRGLGKQLIAALASFVSFYVVGIPLAMIFAFPAGAGLVGMWGGLACALFCCVSSYCYICYKSEWSARDTAHPRTQDIALLDASGEFDEQDEEDIESGEQLDGDITVPSSSDALHDVFQLADSDDEDDPLNEALRE